MSDISNNAAPAEEPGTPKSESFLRKLLRWIIWFIVIVYLILGCAWLAARYFLAPYIEGHKAQIENKISETVSAPVTFGSVDAGWSGLQPEVTLKNIQLGGSGQNPIEVESLSAKLSLRSIPSMEPIFETVTLDKPVVTVERKGPMKFSILGKTIDLNKLLSGETDLESASTKLPKDIQLLLKQRLLEIKDGTIKLVDDASGNTLEIKDFNAAFESSSGEKLFAFTLTPPSFIGSPITVKATLKPPLLDAAVLANWDAEFFAQTDYLNFGELAKWLPDFQVKYRGIGSGSAWLTLAKWKPSSASFIGALSNVDVQLPDMEPLKLKYVKGKISGAMSPQDYSVSTEDFGFELESGEVLPPLNLAVKLKRTENNSFSGGSFKADEVDFKSLSALLPSLPLPKEFKSFIAARRLSGKLSNVDISWQGSPDAPKEYNGSLKIVNFSSFGAQGKNNTLWLPGFQNVTADVSMKNGVGTAVLQTKGADFAFPGLFSSAAFRLDNLTGTVEWSTQDHFSINLKDVTLENADASVTVNGTYRTDGSPFGFMDITAGINRGNAAAVWKYMPLIVGTDTINWLRYGLLKGKATGGSARILGQLHNFPFKGSENEKFEVTVNADDVTVDVYPLKFDKPSAQNKAGGIWPVFTKVGGVVRFSGDGMHITADKGSYKNASLISAKVDIPSFSADTVWLDVDASAKGDIPSYLAYVKASPVNGYTAELFSKAEGSGSGTLQLGLKIPLDGPGSVAVNGAFTADNDSINFRHYQIPDLTQVSGTVQFSEKGVNAQNIKALCFDEPVTASIVTNSKGAIEVKASGTVSAKALPQIIPNEELALISKDYFRGSTTFAANIKIDGSDVNVDIKSPLKGLESALPSPMTKPAAQTSPLHLTIKSSGSLTDVSVMVDAYLSTEFILKNGEIDRCAIGNKSLPSLPQHGYAVAFDTPFLSAAAWTKVFDALDKTENNVNQKNKAIKLPDIASARISIGELELENFNQNNLTITGKSVNGQLSASIRSDQIQGAINWRKGGKGVEPHLTANLSKLYIPDAAETVAEKTKPVEIQGGWPAINAVIGDLTYGKRRLGHVELVARNTVAANGHLWQIQKLNVSNPAATLKSSGSWLKRFDGFNETHLLLDNEIKSLGGMLTRLDMPNLISGGSGSIKGDLSWEGTPLGFNTESFDGTLNIDLRRGEILKIQPGPAAKLLSLLSLQSLTRYLTLDFRDFYSSGFNFTTIQGKADIDNGLMNIKGLTLVGGSATVVMNGTINTQKETENLHLLVLPDINAAGASIALAIANPIAGIGSFLAQLIFKDPLSKLFSFEYNVTGTWADPIVTKVDSHKF